MAQSSTTWKKGQPSPNPGGRLKLVEEVRNLAQTHTEDAVRAIYEIMEDTRQQGSVRIAAANAILDRGWGKPAQSIAVSQPNDVSIDMLTTEELKRRIVESLQMRSHLASSQQIEGGGVL